MNNSNIIELEHIALVFATTLVQLNKKHFEVDKQGRIKFLRMNAAKRLKLIDKTLSSLAQEAL